MKVIISYVSAGAGHYRAAQALYDYVIRDCRDTEVILIDALEKSHPVFKNIYTYGYIFLVNHLLWLWRFFFWVTSVRYLRLISDFLNCFLNRINTRSFCEFLIAENPDYIISTHFLTSETAAYLKKRKKINSLLISVVTDFSAHPFWIYKETDIYVVASGATKAGLVESGVEEGRIKDFGIPVKPEFLLKYDKDALKKNLGLAKDRFTVLVVTGSFGIGPIEEIVELLYEENQVLVVCAGNRKLYRKLKSKNYPQVSVFGFVDNMHELMVVSDLIITKPGGLTISEVLVMGLAPVFISPIPGQETENIRILQGYGIGETLKRSRDIKGIIAEFKENPVRLEEIKKRIFEVRRPFAAKEICDGVCKGSFRYSR